MQLNVVLIETFQFLLNGIHQQLHQTHNLVFRPFPVFSRESIEGEVLDAELCTAFHYVTYTFHSMEMSIQSVLIVFLCPTAVTVHNDCNVSGEMLKVYL